MLAFQRKRSLHVGSSQLQVSFGKKPKPSFYDVTSHNDGDNTSIYTRKQLFDTILYYWNRLRPKLGGGHCYFFPYYRYSTEDYQTVTVFGEKVPMTENDVKFYEKWLKQVVSFPQEYLRNQELMLSVSDQNQIKTRITASKKECPLCLKITEQPILDCVALVCVKRQYTLLALDAD